MFFYQRVNISHTWMLWDSKIQHFGMNKSSQPKLRGVALWPGSSETNVRSFNQGGFKVNIVDGLPIPKGRLVRGQYGCFRK